MSALSESVRDPTLSDSGRELMRVVLKVDNNHGMLLPPPAREISVSYSVYYGCGLYAHSLVFGAAALVDTLLNLSPLLSAVPSFATERADRRAWSIQTGPPGASDDE